MLPTVVDVIREVARQQLGREVAVKAETDLLDDLSFASLDYAEVVAILETRLGIDPFKEGATLSQVRTVKDLAAIYQGIQSRGARAD